MTHRQPRPVDVPARLATAAVLVVLALAVIVGPATVARGLVAQLSATVATMAGWVGVELPDGSAPDAHARPAADGIPVVPVQSVDPAAPGYACPSAEDAPGYWDAARCGNGLGADVDNTGALRPGELGRPAVR